MSCILRSFNYMCRSIASSWRKLRYKVTTPFICSRFLMNDDKSGTSSDSTSSRITHPGLKFVLSEHEEKIKRNLNIDGISEIAGTGGFAECYVVMKKSYDGTKVKEFALKVHSTKDMAPLGRDIWYKRAQREIYLLDLCSHPNMVKRFHSTFLDGPTPGIKCHVAIMMERLDCTLGHLLIEDVDEYPIDASIHLAKQITSAIEWMHRKGVSNHDLKSTNIMLVKRPRMPNIEEKLMSVEYKLIDLGLSRFYKPNELEATFSAGTSFYCSREKKKCQGYDPFLSDAFALGVILLETLVGYYFIREEKHNRFRSFTTISARYRAMLPSEDRENGKYMLYLNAIENLLNKDVNERTRVDEFIKQLERF